MAMKGPLTEGLHKFAEKYKLEIPEDIHYKGVHESFNEYVAKDMGTRLGKEYGRRRRKAQGCQEDGIQDPDIKEIGTKKMDSKGAVQKAEHKTTKKPKPLSEPGFLVKPIETRSEQLLNRTKQFLRRYLLPEARLSGLWLRFELGALPLFILMALRQQVHDLFYGYWGSKVVYVIISLLMYFASEHKQRIVYDMVVTSLMLVMCGGIAMHIIDDSFMLGILTFALTLIALRARVYGTKKVSKWIGL